MKRSVMLSRSGVLLALFPLLYGYSAKAQNNNSVEGNTYVSCCIEDFNLSGKVKRMKISSYSYEDGAKARLPKSEITYNFDIEGKCVTFYSNDYTYSIPTHQKIEYSYDSSGNVLTEVYTEDGEIFGKKSYLYNPFREITYNENNEVEEVFSIEKDGTYSDLGFTGTLITKSADSEGQVLSKKISFYKDGRLTKQDEYSDESVSSTTVYTYDPKGNMLLAKTTDTTGTIKRKEVNTYSDDVLVSTEVYLLFSTLEIAQAYRYDTKGREVYYCSYMVLPNYLIEYSSYEEDSYGNWRKQWIRNRNNEVTQLIEREIEYF